MNAVALRRAKKPSLVGSGLGGLAFLSPHEMGRPKDGRDKWLAPVRRLGEAETVRGLAAGSWPTVKPA